VSLSGTVLDDKYHRLQAIAEGSIDLKPGHARPLDGPMDVGSGLLREEQITLSRMIDLLNERFGTDFNQADQFFFDQITEIAIDDERLQQAAKVNPQDKFSLGFSHLLETLMLERMEQNEAIVARFMNDPEFPRAVAARLATEAYERLGGVAKSLEGKLYSKRKKTL
jgi:type I restriction enzyme R subunit